MDYEDASFMEYEAFRGTVVGEEKVSMWSPSGRVLKDCIIIDVGRPPPIAPIDENTARKFDTVPLSEKYRSNMLMIKNYLDKHGHMTVLQIVEGMGLSKHVIRGCLNQYANREFSRVGTVERPGKHHRIQTLWGVKDD